MQDNLVIRQTYIILAVKNNCKYIFNRSVRWDSIINCKKVQPLLNLLGEDIIKNFSKSLFENNTEKMNRAINKFTRGFLGDYPLGYLETVDDVDLFVIQILPFENINRSDQQEINKTKNELCEKFNAKCVKDEFIGDEINKIIGDNIKKNFKRWLKDVYIEISKYTKTTLDNEVIVGLMTTIQGLNDEINKLQIDRQNNSNSLSRQNFVINKLHSEINSLENEKNKLVNQINGLQIVLNKLLEQI